MGAIAMVLRLRLRRQWKSWLALAILVALVSSFVLAAATAGRRTTAAFPAFVARHGYDAVVYSAHPLPGLREIPQVASVTTAPAPFVAALSCVSCGKINASGAVGMFEVPPGALSRMVKLVAGRMPDQSDPAEVLASYTIARDSGVRVGSVIQVLTPTAAQLTQVQQGRASAAALLKEVPRHAVRVVGLVVAENEFPVGYGPRYDLFPTKALAAAINRRTPVLPVYYVQLAHGAADLPAFDSQLRPLRSLGADDLDLDAAAVQGAIKPQAVGWWVLAGLAGLAGLAVVGQAAARQFVTDQDDHRILSALGMQGQQFVVLGLARAAVIGTAGAIGAATLAALLSPLTPVGEARLATSSAGRVVIDPAGTAIGALVTVAVVVALSAWPAVRHARLQRRDPPRRGSPNAVVRAIVRLGAPPSALMGVRYALDRGRGSQPTPVGTALLGMVLAVTALCATVVFGASLTRLVSSPELYGAPFQAEFTNQGTGSASVLTGSLLAGLRQDPAIARVTLASVVEIEVNGRHVRSLAVTAIRGDALISVVDGRLPAGDHDIMLGAATLRAIGARPGGTIQVTVRDPVSGGPHTVPFRVIGRASFLPSFGTGGLGSGAVMTVSAMANAQCPSGTAQSACMQAAGQGLTYSVLARSVPGPAGAAALARYTGKYRPYVASIEQPIELVNFGESVNFPLLFGVALALFAAATMLHLLLVSVTRRRAETGLLKALGFVRYQVAAVVTWQATAVAVVGILGGVPLGIAAGRLLWQVFATNFGVVPLTVIQVLPVAVLGLGVLAAANVFAFVPAILAARSLPAQLLRAE
jgi:hypothetical protein